MLNASNYGTWHIVVYFGNAGCKILKMITQYTKEKFQTVNYK